MRVVRVNELIKRELSAILHTRYQEQSVRITVSEVNVAPNLRSAEVYYNVLGEEADAVAAGRFFARARVELRKQLGRNIVLKYLPHLSFHHDNSLERGNRLNALMDEMGLEGDPEPPDDAGEPTPQ
jgi:ribosome-binding factor A